MKGLLILVSYLLSKLGNGLTNSIPAARGMAASKTPKTHKSPGFRRGSSVCMWRPRYEAINGALPFKID
jgi:hypothetical protein